MELRIRTNPEIIQLEDMIEDLQKHEYLRNINLGFDLRLPKDDYRSVDPVGLAVAIGALEPFLVPIIAGLLDILKNRSAQKIVLRSSTGATIEVPINTPMDKIDMLVEKIKKLESANIDIAIQ